MLGWESVAIRDSLSIIPHVDKQFACTNDCWSQIHMSSLLTYYRDIQKYYFIYLRSGCGLILIPYINNTLERHF